MDIRQTAIDILVRGISGGDTEFLQIVIAEDYRQHNPRVPDGRDGIIGMVDYLKSNNQLFKIEPVRTLVDGNIVAVHGKHIGETTSAAFDLFAFENGIAVEHWDGIQEWPESTVSGRTMTDGPTEITDLDKTEANRELVIALYKDVLIEGKAEKIGEYLGDEYHQHNPGIADGADGLLAFFGYLEENQIAFAVEETHRSIAEGNFVLLQSTGQREGAPIVLYDLFRVEGGKIVEHWDTLQEVPEEMAHENKMV